MSGDELLDSLGRLLGAKIQSRIEFRGETTFSIQPEDLHEVAKFCRDELSFDYLIDISSIDNFGDEPRFEVVYELYSMTLAVYLRLKLAVSEEVCAVDTVSDLWPTADWHEREIYDMMGIRFNNHPDLRRILMWDGYPFFPLRKDFPLEGLPSEMPDVAFTSAAPMEGGPFVPRPSTATPKQRERDGRTPEGNSNSDFHKSDSAFHRALRISYPGAADTRRGAEAGEAPGGDIMIRGLPNGVSALGRAHRLRDWSAGCIALTD